jgi:cell division protein FtsL
MSRGMVRSELDPVILVPKAIDNSQVVREVDPRSSRDLWWLVTVVGILVSGLVLYAWPHLQVREVDSARVRMSRERERLVEENRKLRLEKASLQNLRRVEQIAVRDLGLRPPPPESLVVVERPSTAPDNALLAGGSAVVPGPVPAAPAATPQRAREN